MRKKVFSRGSLSLPERLKFFLSGCEKLSFYVHLRLPCEAFGEAGGENYPFLSQTLICEHLRNLRIKLSFCACREASCALLLRFSVYSVVKTLLPSSPSCYPVKICN